MVGKKRAGGTSQAQKAQVEARASSARPNRRRSARGQKVEESQQVLDVTIPEENDLPSALMPVIAGNEAGIDFPDDSIAQSYHIVLDDPGTEEFQEYTLVDNSLAMQYVHGNELQVYQDFSYDQDQAGTSSAASGMAINSMVLGKPTPTAGPSSGAFLRPGQLVMTGAADKFEQVPQSQLLFGKYAFPQQLQPYTPGSRTFVTLSAQERDQILAAGSRNFATYRAVLTEGSVLNAIEDYREIDKTRRHAVIRLARMVHEQRHMRGLLEENTARLTAKCDVFQQDNVRLKQDLQVAMSKIHQLEANNMADQKTAEQMVFHEKKFNDIVDGLKAEYHQKLQKYKVDQDLLKNLKKRHAKLKKLYNKTKNLMKVKEGTLEVPALAKEPEYKEQDTHFDDGVVSQVVEQNVRQENTRHEGAVASLANIVLDPDLLSVGKDLLLSDDEEDCPEPESCFSNQLTKKTELGNSQDLIADRETEYFTNTGTDMLPSSNSRLSDSEDEAFLKAEIKYVNSKEKLEVKQGKWTQRSKNNDLGLSDTDGSVSDAEVEMTATITVHAKDSILSKKITEEKQKLSIDQKGKTTKAKKSRKRGRKVASMGMSKKKIAELVEESLKGEEYNERTKRRRAIKRETLKKMKASQKVADTPVQELEPTPIPEVKKVETAETGTAVASPAEALRRTSRRKQVMEKIGDTTVPQPVVASCDKVRLTHQIERARENKNKRKSAQAVEEQLQRKKRAIGEAPPTPVPVDSTLNTRKLRDVSGVETPVRIAPDLLAYDSPKSPPKPGTSKWAPIGSVSVDAKKAKAAANVLEKYFHQKTLAELKENSDLICHALTDELAFPPTALARAIGVALLDKARGKGKVAETFVDRLEMFIQFIENSKLEQFKQFTDVILQDFEYSVTAEQNSSDIIYKRLGKYYGRLLDKRTASAGVGSQNDLALDIILHCMYQQPDRALAFLHELLLQHSDPFNMHKNEFNRENFKRIVHFQIMLYVTERGKKGQAQALRLLRNFTNQSLCHRDLFKNVDHDDFIEHIFKQLKGLESDTLIQKAFKAIGMFFKHFDDGIWNWIRVAQSRLETIWNEYNRGQVHAGILAGFLLMISDIVGNMKNVGSIAELRETVAQIGCDDEEVAAAAMKCREKLDEFNSANHLINLKSAMTEKKEKRTGPLPPATKNKGRGRGRGGKGNGKQKAPFPAPPVRTELPPIGLAQERKQRANRGKRSIFSL